MPVFFLEPFKKISFPVRPEAEIVKQTGKVFRGEDGGLVGFLLSSHASSLCNEKRQKQKKPLRFLARA